MARLRGRGTIGTDLPGAVARMADTRTGGGMTSIIDWRAVGAGFLAAAGLALILGMIGSRLGIEGHVGTMASLELLALMVGGYVAGRLAGRFGVMQGVAVAIIFIVISASIKAWVEIDLASRFGMGVLGPMDMGGLVLGDLVHLIGACAGGWLADSQRGQVRGRA